MDAEALKIALERLNEVLPLVPGRIETLAAEEESLRAAVEVFLHDLQTKQAEAADLLAKLEVGIQDLRRESREGIAVLEGHQDLAVVLEDPSVSFEATLSHAAAEMGGRQLQIAAGRVSALGDEREARAGLLEAVFTAASARLGSGGELIAGATQAGMAQASEVVTSTETARAALAESVESLGHEIEAQRAAGLRDLEELRRDLAALETSFAQRAERIEAAVRHDLAQVAEDTRERTADLRETLEKAAARVTDALHDLDRELDDANQESQGARRDLVPVFQDLAERVEALKHAIEAVREAAQVVGIPF